MPKISLNELIKSNNAPVALNFIFADYADAKKAQQRAKQSGKLRIIKEGGKELPTPNELVGQLAKRQVKGAYTLSDRLVALGLTGMAKARGFITRAGNTKADSGPRRGHRPCTENQNLLRHAVSRMGARFK
jgi:hypothetical protein